MNFTDTLRLLEAQPVGTYFISEYEVARKEKNGWVVCNKTNRYRTHVPESDVIQALRQLLSEGRSVGFS